MTDRFRLGPDDELTHTDEGEPTFNESMYANFFDPARRLGGFLRVGNRPNEGHAEVTVCLFRPDGTVAFQYARPEIAGNERVEAGGASFRVEAPFERLRLGYRGRACLLARPLDMSDPRRAFRENPSVPVELDLLLEGTGPPVGGEREGGAASVQEREFARGHYEQHHRATGRVRVADEASDFAGHGLRDHSWGPRSWQSPRAYRWLTASFGDDLGFMATRITARDGSETRGGFVHRGRERVGVRDVEIETAWRAADGGPDVHDRIRARLHQSDGRVLEVEGRVLSLIPLRNRRGGRTTRISEGMTEWTCGGRTGYGLSEYLDQIDGPGDAAA